MLSAEAEDDGARGGCVGEEGGREDGDEDVLPTEGVEEADGGVDAGREFVHVRGDEADAMFTKHGR